MEETAYCINSARAISETLDGETIIINLDSGNYYSINRTATIIWQQLESICSSDTIVRALNEQYDAPIDTLQKSVADSLAFLLQEQLILEMPASATSVTQSKTTHTETSMKKAFIPAKIDKYDDMQEMLLADPIHDVDATGWPQLKK